MKKTLFLAALAIASAPFASAITCNWSNTLGNNDFGAFSNWSPVPATFQGNAFDINLSGANRSAITNTLAPSLALSGRVRLGTQVSRMGELLISGGTNTFGDGIQVGATGTGLFTLTSGYVGFLSNFTTISESSNSVGTLAMSGGAFVGDRVTAATALGASGTIVITGGDVTIFPNDPTPSLSTSGSLRLGSGAAQLHIGGTAQVTAQTLILGPVPGTPMGPGLMTMSNGVLNLTGATLTNMPPIIFCPGRPVDFEGGVWNVDGDVRGDIQQAISAGLLYHSAGNDWIRVTFDTTNTVVKIQQPTALESWRFQYFGTIEDAGDAANAADPENDGIPNLVEFAFALHPLQSNAGQLPNCTVSGGNLTIEFTQPGGVSGVSYGAEFSTNLMNWSAVANSGTGATNVFTVSIESQPRGFLRLLAIEQ